MLKDVQKFYSTQRATYYVYSVATIISKSLKKVKSDITILFHRALTKLENFTFRGDDISPIKHIYLKKDLTDRLKHSHLRNIANYCLEKGVAFAVSAYLRDVEHNCPEPSIRLVASRKLNPENIAKICSLLDEAYENVGPKPDLLAV